MQPFPQMLTDNSNVPLDIKDLKFPLPRLAPNVQHKTLAKEDVVPVTFQGLEEFLISIPTCELAMEDLQELADNIYDGLDSEKAGLIFTSEVLTKIWSYTGAVPSKLMATDVIHVSHYPFAGTPSSDIYKGSTLSSTPIALKTSRHLQEHSDMKEFFFEAVLSSSLVHRNVLPFRGIYKSPSGVLYLTSALMNQGTLREHLKSNPDADRLHLVTKIAGALCYLHGLEIPVIHHDVRTFNILVDEYEEPLIMDFGISLMLDPDFPHPVPSSHISAGNPRWSPYETIQSLEDLVGTPSDVYSFACLCVEVFSGEVPFSHLTNDGAVIMEIFVRQRHPLRPVGEQALQLTDDIWELLVKCWARDPAARPTMKEIYNFLLLRSGLAEHDFS